MNDNLKLNIGKLKALLHYSINKANSKDDLEILEGMKNNFGLNILFKLMYFVDFNFYEIKNTYLTGERYIKRPSGPVPAHFKIAKDELLKEGKIKENNKNSSNPFDFKYISLEYPNMDMFDEEELFIIDESINKLLIMNEKQLTEYSKEDLPYKFSEENEELDYDFVFYRDSKYSFKEYFLDNLELF